MNELTSIVEIEETAEGTPKVVSVTQEPKRVTEPLQDMVFVKDYYKGTPKQIGKIIVPESARDNDRLNRGTVYSVGPGCPDHRGGGWVNPRQQIAPGDKILFGAYDELTLEDGTKVAMVKYSINVVGVLRAEENIYKKEPSYDEEDIPF